MRWLHIPAMIVAVLAVFSFFFHLGSDDSAVVSLDLDTVAPLRAKAGGTVSVYRSFRVLRDDDFVVTRLMVRGDCAVNCEFIDLSTSKMTLKAGDYLSVKREHAIPTRVTPGFWMLKFTWHWKDRLGRERSIPMPPLAVEVVE